MFDIFYIGKKPNLFSIEREADSIEDAQRQSRTRYFWIINTYSDYSDWDFLWEPVPWESNQRHAWPSQWQKDAETYLIPKAGYGETNYHTDRSIVRLPTTDNWVIPEHVEDFDTSWHPDPTEPQYQYQFGTQWQATGGPRYHMPGATAVKYMPTPRTTKTTIDSNWHVPKGIDFNDFDYTWHPDDRDPPYIYQFGTQWQKTGGPTYKLPGADQVKYVTQVRAKGSRMADQAVMINHSNDNYLEPDIDIVKNSRYFDNYLDTLKRVAKTLPEDMEFVWILSSLCDYTDFDFTWHPEQWQQGMLHVFQSDGEKFGDTFFMHVSSFRDRIDSVELLDWYDLNFLDISVPRRPIPWIRHGDDSHVEQVKQCTLTDPLIVFQNADYDGALPAVPLWRAKTKTVTPLTKGGTTVIVPRQAITAVQEQLWDYEYVDKRHQHYQDAPLDVVFIENGEVNAEENYQHLEEILRDKPNKLHRVSNVKGRVAAYRAAADASTTPWLFTVFAKLKIDKGFDWSWQPDRLQQPKHYIFHARNPINGLEYGHMAMIAYNKKLVLSNTAPGLDFTLDQLHEVVPVLSGVANYADDELMAWRSAFREVLKLKAGKQTMDTQYRLRTWLSKGEGIKGEWSKQGAKDAVDYYESVEGDFDKLKLSYDWEWLNAYYNLLHA